MMEEQKFHYKYAGDRIALQLFFHLFPANKGRTSTPVILLCKGQPYPSFVRMRDVRNGSRSECKLFQSFVS